MDTKPEISPTLPARERLLLAADELFYENSINTVGIDRVIERAGVAKASLYDCFGSKEELIAAYLRRRQDSRKARIEQRAAQFDHPREKILCVFDLLGEIAVKPEFRGCAFVRASADASAGGKVKAACAESRAWMLEMFTTLARECDVADPETLGEQLVLLYDGAMIAAHVDRNRKAADEARALVAKLLPEVPSAKPSARDRHAGKESPLTRPHRRAR